MRKSQARAPLPPIAEAPAPDDVAVRGKVSPRILGTGWGTIDVEGVGKLRDAKLYPGGAREWDWRETGTAHVPGIQPSDVRELLDHGATAIILSQGVLRQLGVCEATLQLLRERGVRSFVLPTPEAVALYNDLREKEPVGGLFHTTC